MATGDDQSPPSYGGIFETAKKEIVEFTEDHDTLEPIAIVGFSFGFPGNATSSDAFWKMLMSKRGSTTGIPEQRFSSAAMYHPDANRKGQVSNMPWKIDG